MRIILIFVCLLIGTSTLQAQNSLWGPSVSYQYQKGSIVKVGGYYATEINNTNILKIDATANFTWTQGKYAVIPEVAVAYYSDMYYIGAFGRAEITPYTITPKVGLSLFTLFEVDLGYGLPIADKTDYRPIKGFTTSIRFNIPINSKF
ncbi:hypothetical protein HX071_14995 [Myroides marinus]|uniref:hypothetical protein n=1 Tax=Myroides marinus TaxID=703342 RepID=UPI0025778E37|nr:hypothetical protein [Myroides marinus]MDM1347626.1 hypothetical protein [Myroides marinus]MDM1363098.1 hypothetical protein [Myroides marinus]MDM1503494.1 hypothetical protein [Myroides marinus]